VRRVLRSCWVTKSVATAALVEAAARGLADVCAVLIAAGAAPGGPKAAADWIPNKTAFHCACENGHEELAALLLASMSERCEVEVRVGGGGGGGGGLTAVELARQADLGGVARRVQALIDEKFPPLHA
jgi:ankyrin repeat protein